MAVGNEDPIFIVNEQPSASKTAHINNNFQVLSNALNLNLKVVDSGSFTVTAVAGSTVTGTYTHNLNYSPVILVSVQKSGDSTVYQIPRIVSPSSSTNYVVISAYTNSTTLTASFELGSNASSSAGDWLVTYFLLRRKAA